MTRGVYLALTRPRKALWDPVRAGCGPMWGCLVTAL